MGRVRDQFGQAPGERPMKTYRNEAGTGYTTIRPTSGPVLVLVGIYPVGEERGPHKEVGDLDYYLQDGMLVWEVEKGGVAPWNDMLYPTGVRVESLKKDLFRRTVEPPEPPMYYCPGCGCQTGPAGLWYLGGGSCPYC